jgi:enamine deaminase RidA (YjgF/YER057c/UK114 family)
MATQARNAFANLRRCCRRAAPRWTNVVKLNVTIADDIGA